MNYPMADFEGDETTIFAGGTVDFNDLSTNNPNNWYWTFDGGTPNTSDEQNPQNIIYDYPGYYTVTLIASNNDGYDTEIKEGYIHVEENPLNADFEAYPTSITTGGSVQFTDLSTNAISWDWDFGDGGTSWSRKNGLRCLRLKSIKIKEAKQ